MRKGFLENYSHGLSAFPPELVDHFPRRIAKPKRVYVRYPFGAQEAGMAFMLLSHQVDSAEFYTIKSELKLNKFKAHRPADSIFIIVGDTVDYSNNTLGIPIPSFKSFERDFELNSKYLPEYYKLYVTEYKSGKYLEEEFLTSGNNLPQKWRNGFSRGLATNEKNLELIYWLCVW